MQRVEDLTSDVRGRTVYSRAIRRAIIINRGDGSFTAIVTTSDGNQFGAPFPSGSFAEACRSLNLMLDKE